MLVELTGNLLSGVNGPNKLRTPAIAPLFPSSPFSSKYTFVMDTQAPDRKKSVRNQVTREEWQKRVDLAAKLHASIHAPVAAGAAAAEPAASLAE